ncbi:3-hydroxyacyl-CoA dehydrogenase family protein [Chloroflexota bacterium]
MKLEDMENAAVIGAGMMGSQIAEILSRIGGYRVNLVDTNESLVSKGLQNIDHRLEQFYLSKGKITLDQKKDIFSRIHGSTSLSDAVHEVDFVIEAVVENMDLKKEIFRKLDSTAPPRAILASNTSLLNISEIASATRRPDRVLGIHFFNPVATMQLVEVVKGSLTSEDVVQVACALARKLGKEQVVCNDFSFGFIANRAYRGMLDEAVQMVWERVAGPEDIDKAIRLGYGLPKGPLELWDAIGGWAIKVAAEQDAIKELGNEKGRMHPLVRAMARTGYTGGKNKGIYDYWKDVLSK